jgi:hypothetical protein
MIYGYPAQFQTPARCRAPRLSHTAEQLSPDPIPTSSPLPAIVIPEVQRTPPLPEDFPPRDNSEILEPLAYKAHEAAVNPEACSDREVRPDPIKKRPKPDSKRHKYLNGMRTR